MAQCEICGTEMTQGRGRARRTCSAACRQAAHRRRRAEELKALRSAPPAPGLSRDVPVPDDGPAGRIRAAGAALAAAAGHAATAAEEGAYRDDSLVALQRRYADLVDAVREAMPARETSRNERQPVAEPSRPAAPAEPKPEPPRNETLAGTAPQEPSGIKAEPQKMPRKRAMAIVEAAQLERAGSRDTSQWVLRSGETVLGHVEPSYGGASRSGRNGWKGLLPGEFVSRPLPTRDAASAELARKWVQLVTSAPRRTITGG